MQVKVSDPAFTFDLLYSLKRTHWAVAQMSSDTLVVRDPKSGSSPEQAELHLGHYLANWRARHPGVIAEVVEVPERNGNGRR